jgi:glycosidase
MQGKGSTDALADIQDRYVDIEAHLLHFLENHDEQRIASAPFAGDARAGRPAMLVSAAINRAPTMLYFAQELGEPGDGDAGFGKASRSSIFDYWGVPSQQRWMNGGRFDGGALKPDEAQLREFYRHLLNYCASQPALRGAYAEIHRINRQQTVGYDDRVFAFTRWTPDQQVLVIANFDRERARSFDLEIPLEVSANWHLESGQYTLIEQLGSGLRVPMQVHPGGALVSINLPPLAAYLFEVER